MASRASRLYEQDFYAWTQDQAGTLRHLAETRPNLPVDFDHLIEEVEDLGRSLRHTVRSQLRRILEHCLKLRWSPATEPRHGWILGIGQARTEIEDLLTPTLRQDLAQSLPGLYAQARRETMRALLLYGESDAANALPDACPWTLDELLAPDWLPPGPSRD